MVPHAIRTIYAAVLYQMTDAIIISMLVHR